MQPREIKARNDQLLGSLRFRWNKKYSVDVDEEKIQNYESVPILTVDYTKHRLVFGSSVDQNMKSLRECDVVVLA